jgi:aldehyde:ferredoxin oxidoreductase
VNKEEFEAAKKLYYGMMGWDNHAIPAPTKLAELGLFDLMVQEKGG